MKKICLLLLLFIPLAELRAQESLTPKEIITQVMQSEEDFLFADQTCATVEQALERAQAILMREVDAYLKQSGEDGEIVKGLITEQMVTITIQRGDKYRAFVYINKADLGTTNPEKPVGKASTTEEAKVVEKVVAPTTPASSEVTIGENKAERPSEVDATTKEDDVLRQITAMTSRLQVYDYICLLQKDGVKITFVEHPKTEEQSDMYLVLYKRGGKIEAILSPIDSQGVRYNLTTGQPDLQTNHPATSMNGFIYER